MPSQGAQVAIYLPALFAFSQQDLARLSVPELPALATVLRFANHSDSEQTAPADLHHLWQLCCETAVDTAPVAALSAYAVDHYQSERFYLRADPVHLQLDRDAAYLLPPHVLQLSDAEQADLLLTLNHHLAPLDARLFAAHLGAWVMELAASIDLQTTALSQAALRSVVLTLPRGTAAKHWQAVITEIQMLLHEHPVNQQRNQQHAVNSVWLWGEGDLPANVPTQTFTHLWSNDIAALGLGRYTGMVTQYLDQLIASVPKLTAADRWVCFDNRLQQAYDAGQADVWLNALQQFDADCLQVLLAALQARQFSQLTLYTDHRRYVLKPWMLRRFWRRSRPLFRAAFEIDQDRPLRRGAN